MTDLWMVRIDRPMRQAESEALLALLPQERRNRLHGHTLEKQPEVLCAYGLLLALLRKRCGWQGFPAVARNAEDKPFFPAYPGVCFSISHTEGPRPQRWRRLPSGWISSGFRPRPGGLPG